jgi:hypothetical protein
MEHIMLCPQADSNVLLPAPDPSNFTEELYDTFHLTETSNNFLRQGTKRREGEVDILEELIERRATFGTGNVFERDSIEEKLSTAWDSHHPLLSILETSSLPPPLGKPLRACILAIIWECAEKPNSISVLKAKDFEKFVFLLNSAARYQTASEGVSIPLLSCTVIQSLVVEIG